MNDVIFALKKDRWEKDMSSPMVNARHDAVADLLAKLTEQIFTVTETQKRERGVLTFDDLEFLTWDLVSQHPEVAASLHVDWDFWFIDEFQDTSPLQKKLLFSFFREPWNAYFVGDPQQSIYLFRGADENVFQDTKLLVEERGGIIDRLAINYRSQPDLLKFLNGIFSSLSTPMETLQARAPEEGKLCAEVHLADKEVDEARLALLQILEWKKAGHEFHDMSILVRTNDKARLIAQSLSQAGVPVYVHTTGGYYDRREILDALALLVFIEDPSDDEAFIIAARSPWIAVPDTVLAGWGLARKKKAFWDWLTPELIEVYPTLCSLREAVEKASLLPLSQVFYDLTEKLGLLEFSLVGDSSGRREANLRKLFWSLKQAEEKPGFTAAEFIDDAWDEIIGVGEEAEAASFVETPPGEYHDGSQK